MHTGYYLDLINLRKDCPEADFGYLENEFAGTSISAATFLHGYCDSFACELSRAFGYGIEEIRDYENHLIHAYCVVDTGASRAYIDIRGITTNAEAFFAEFEDYINIENGHIEESQFEDGWLLVNRYPDAETYVSYYPVLVPGTSPYLEESAKAFIADNFGFYYMDISPEEHRQDYFRIFEPGLIGDLYHVGTMDISKKSRFSFEGNGLSVSNCPDEWVAITEGVTHGDYFKLFKPDMRLLDYYGLSDDEKKIIQTWAIRNGYVRQGTVYKSLSWDEDGREFFSLHASYDEAFEEAGEEEDYVEEVSWLLPTEKLVDQSLVNVGLLDIPDIITELYAEQVLDYDGIYWDEDLDVTAYSAPRGVIFNSKISSFEVSNITKGQEKPASLDSQIQSAHVRAIGTYPAEQHVVKPHLFRTVTH